MFRRFVLGIDRWVRRRLGIYEFTDDPRCVFRLSRESADRDVPLSDGTRIAAGEPLVGVHLWNEHLPLLAARGGGLAGAARAARLTEHSLRLLAAHLETHPALRDVRALHGRVAVPAPSAGESPLALARRLGFEVRQRDCGAAARFRDFWNAVHLWALVRVFNPGRLRKERGNVLRWAWFDLWMSREALLARYGPAARREGHRRRGSVRDAG